MSALRTVPGNLSSQRQGIQGRHEGIFGGFAGRTADFTCCSPLFFFRLQKHRKPNAKIPEEENPYLPELPLEERRRRLKERFGELDIRDFACGYNRIENCVHYVKDENFRISMIDIRSGIPNYNAYLNFTERLLNEGKLAEYSTIYFNINNFKFINQKFGFRQGDAALREYCAAVAEMATAEELVALVGGNNFVGVIRRERLELILKALEAVPVSCIKEPITGKKVFISARVAIYMPDGTDTSPQMIMEKLSTTYDEINREQNQTVRYYDEKIRKRKIREDLIMHAIAPALEAGEFEVYYQPKVSMKTRKITGAEALIRWNHDGKVVSPGEFIPICEKTGQVQKLDFYVLETVCRHIKEWLERGIEVVTVSVNFSKHHFVEDTVAEHINRVAEKWGIPKQHLEIEFTETAYIEGSRNLSSSINKLHGYGISASMDDFGTGYSSLSMLQNMSFDTLKLDKSFLDNGTVDENRSRVVIGNIIRMAKELDMSIVSEGIETEMELEYMKGMNCDIAQGYLFDKPLTHDEFEKRLLQTVYE